MPRVQLIDGKALAIKLQADAAGVVAELRDRHRITPGLAALLIGDDPASAIYVRNKTRACAAVGIASFEQRLPADASQSAIMAQIERLNGDERVDGILVQLPLPPGLDSRMAIAAVDPAKDVDGFHPVNVGRLWNGEPGLVACTPLGVLLLLRSTGRPLAGAEAVVLGRSAIVGRPAAALLLAADCTVTIVHSKTANAPAISRRADIVVAGIGRPAAVTADWIKPGAVVIDVGVNRVAQPDGRSHLVGDVDFASVQDIAGAITPVPGGVGPMTVACLLRNTVVAACWRRGLSIPPMLAAA